MRNPAPSYIVGNLDLSGLDENTARQFYECLAFDVVEPGTSIMDGLPFLKPHGATGYVWCLPSLGGDFDYYLGWEMGQAFLRAVYCPVNGVLDPAPLELSEIAKAMERGAASDSHRDGFFICFGMFLQCAMHGHGEMPRILRRLAWLDDSRLRERCKALLAGQLIADIFDHRFDVLMGC